jgi:hypothetical protein
MKLRPIAIALALLAALASDSWGQSQEPSQRPTEVGQPKQDQPQTAKQPTPADQRGTETAPVIVKVLPTQPTAEQAKQDAKDREEKAANEYEAIKFNKALVIIGAFQLAVFIGQLLVFGWQARRLRQTVDVMTDTAERQLRAYVVITSAEPGWNAAGDFTATVKFTNCGQTPAYNVSISRDVRALNWEAPQFPTIGAAATSKFTLAKDQPMEIELVLNNVAGTSDMRGQRFDGDRSIYIFGEATYHDIFRERLRRTPFRLILVRRESGRFVITPTEEGNDPD